MGSIPIARSGMLPFLTLLLTNVQVLFIEQLRGEYVKELSAYIVKILSQILLMNPWYTQQDSIPTRTAVGSIMITMEI